MKSPGDLARRFARQWGKADLREERFLGGAGSWPISLPIGRPAPGVLATDLDTFKQHLERWRAVRTGNVIWEPTSYRAAAEAIDIPTRWELRDLGEWVDACSDRSIRKESETLRTLVAETPAIFHQLLLRRPSLWRSRTAAEVVQATRLALLLEPGCAGGSPLRTISLAGIDTKFFERNERLVIALLDARFEGEVSQLGLAAFLDAALENDHWIQVVDLDGGLLPFRKMRVPSFELKNAAPPGRRVLIVENESSLHQLPDVPGTIAILGAGFDLTWTDADWLRAKDVAYWGDIDTWGLQFLAKARSAVPRLKALLMTTEIFDTYSSSAVPEPVHAGGGVPEELVPAERRLYERLLAAPRGRLEQEFLPIPIVAEAVLGWAG